MKQPQIKSKLQLGIIFLGIISIALGVKTMLQTPSLILTPLTLVLIFSPLVFGISFLIAFLIKIVFKPTWHFFTISSIFLTLICLTFFLKEHRSYSHLYLQLDEHTPGHYFIISTSDQSKGIKVNKGEPFKFDNNRVIYVDTGLFNHCAINPINIEGKEISRRLKTFMGNKFFLSFYNPTDEEYNLHPEWSDYYLKYDSNDDEEKLKKLGYVFMDSNIKQ